MKTLKNKIQVLINIMIILSCLSLTINNLKAQCGGSTVDNTIESGKNLGFMANTPPTFTGWTAKTGSYTDNNESSPLFTWNQVYTNPSTAMDGTENFFKIFTDTNATDPYSGNNLRIIPTQLGYTRSARIGNYKWGGDCSQLSYKLTVSSDNCLLTICYAMVIQAPHPGQKFVNPAFEIDVVQSGTNTRLTDCAFFQMCGDVSSTNLPEGWHYISGGYDESWAYCDWRQIKVNLAAYNGEDVDIRIRVSDCSYSGHGGYGYVACKVEKPSIELSGCAGAGDTVTTVMAPDGFAHYEWFEIPYSTIDQDALAGFYPNLSSGIVDTNQTLVVTSNMIGNNSTKYYAVKLTSPTEHVSWDAAPAPACEAYIPVTVNDMRPKFDGMHLNRYIEVDPEREGNWVGFLFNDVMPRNETYQMDWQLFEFGDTTNCSVIKFVRDSATNIWSEDAENYPLIDSLTTVEMANNNTPSIIWHNYKPGDYIFTRTAHVRYWDNENCRLLECERNDTLHVHVPVRPCFSLSSRDTICVNDSVKIDVVPCPDDNTQYQYSWYTASQDPLNTAETPFATGTSYILQNLDKDTVIQVKAVNPDGGAYKILNKHIYVQSFPNIKIEGDTMICIGQNLDLKAEDASGYTRALRWTYQRPTNTTSVGLGANPARFNEPVKQDTTVYILAETTKGCFAWDSVNINVVIPKVTADKNQICPGQSVTLTGSGAVKYTWKAATTDLSLTSDTTVDPITVSPDATTIYTMTGYAPNGCSADANVTIEVIDYPTATIGFNPPYVDLDKPTLVITDSSATGYTSVWTFSDGGSATGKTVNYTFSDLTVEEVGIHLVSTNALGCSSEADTTAPIVLFSVWLPTGFTPDGDGHNDHFFFMTENDLLDVTFEIYDRWGAKMYSYETNKYTYGDKNDSQQYGWNGKYNDKDAPNGTYIWRLSYKRDGSTRVYDRTGTITLIR